MPANTGAAKQESKMSEYQFLLGAGHLSASANRIAKRHGARLINYTEPRGEKRHWFSCKNLGAPFDGATARAVKEDLIAAGILRGVE